MGTRRKFLADSLGTVLGGLAVLASGGCEDKRYAYRDDKIKALQESARSYITSKDFVYGEGYVYDVNVPGKIGEKTEKAHVNLSNAFFKPRKNLLKYDSGGLSVRVYRGGAIEVWSGSNYVTDPAILETAQKRTDEVLKAIAEENARVKEKRINEMLKGLRK